MRSIAFDVNETLLDLGGLLPRFEEALGSSVPIGAWFDHMVRHSFVATLTDEYAPFDELGIAALQVVASKAGVELSDLDAAHVVDGMRHLQPHPDVRPAITRLREHGFRVAALTNSPAGLLADQLGNAGLLDLFDLTMSVDQVRKFKPHPDVYRSGADRMGIALDELRLVSVHDWDVTGAIRAGAYAAFVARPGMVFSAASETPDIVGPDLEAVAAAIIATDG